jgi:hypothetical protein
MRRNSSSDKGLQALPLLQPPAGFYIVEENLYRAFSLAPNSITFLDNLRIKCVRAATREHAYICACSVGMCCFCAALGSSKQWRST